MTNPPVPATPLDVEACVRLLDEAKSLLADRARNRRWAAGEAEHSAEGFQWLALANQDDELVAVAGALASALPGMGKDSDGWKHASALSADLTGMAKARDAWREFGYHVAHCVECGQMMYTDCDDGNALHEAARAADDVLDHPIRSAARAAQPEETSADDAG